MNNQDLSYTSQRLTSAWAYYVALVLPVIHPSLPATGEKIMDSVEPGAFTEGLRDYLPEVEADLNAHDPVSIASLTSPCWMPWRPPRRWSSSRQPA